MTEITASLVKELRERTGAGMMDCKKALSECGGDLESSIDWLRKKGLAAAAKKADRVAAEGLVGIAVQDTKGVVVEVNAETDFVGRNDQFQNYVSQISKSALDHGSSLEHLLSAPFSGGTGRTNQEELTHLVAVIGENMAVRRVKKLEVSRGVVVGYTHNAIGQNMGRIGVLIALESDGDVSALEEVGKQIAMHVAAMNPQSLSISDLDSGLVEREKSIITEQASASGKPADVVEKMVLGRLRKFYEEVVLLEQTFIMDPDKKVKDVIADCAKKVGSDVSIHAYACFKLGEGIEKKVDDFAAEVSNLAR
ncbi:MAG: translation elongation factor Ts [Alphaproteobacteria bacterium]